MDKTGVPELHRAALAAALGAPPRRAAGRKPGHGADTSADNGRTPRRTPRPDTASAVTRLRNRHPDMSAADIAARLGITDRTVRRHLAARPDPLPAITAA
jgi:DNA-binding transcriptional ArsR family regulator